MAGKRGRPRQFDEREALTAAARLFWQRGFDGTSLDDLTVAMGMNRPSIYRAFGTKAQIYKAALAAFCGGLDGAVEALRQTPDLHEGLRQFFDAALDIYCGETPQLGCLMVCTAPASAIKYPDVGEDLTGLIHRTDRGLEKRIRTAVEHGALASDTDARQTARLIQGLLHTVALRARAGESKRALRALVRYGLSLMLQEPRGPAPTGA